MPNKDINYLAKISELTDYLSANNPDLHNLCEFVKTRVFAHLNPSGMFISRLNENKKFYEKDLVKIIFLSSLFKKNKNYLGINKFKLLYENQFGFRAGFNTTQPVIHLLDKIVR